MIEDFDTSEKDVRILSDICIVGAGAAGITLARRLKDSGLNVLLLESGGADYEAETQDLYKGELSGLDYYDLKEARLRFFGGTTAIWGGRCAQLDAIDFEKRDWVDDSGWPITGQAIAPYYIQAQKALDLAPVPDNSLPGHVCPFQEGKLTTAFWQFDETFSRFTLPSCRDIKNSKNIRVLLHANAVAIRTSENGAQVTSVEIANLKGGRGIVQARQYILATGGLEIPRLMLSSRTQAHPYGIGNNHDQVGRYFMEHPHGRGARITSHKPQHLLNTFPLFKRYRGQRYGMLMRPSEDFQNKACILNTGFTIDVLRHPGEQPEIYRRAYRTIKHNMAPSLTGRYVWRTFKRTSRWAQDKFGLYMRSQALKGKKYGIYTVARAEQAPNPESRVTLADDKDALGVPLAKLDWQLRDIDKASLLSAMQALDEELKRLDLGRAEPMEWLYDSTKTWVFDSLISEHDKGGYHHMGTTRMGNNPATSVTDPDCRVHGVENLYIAGSSLFPTSGWANPTLTILALSMRLGDLLRNKNK